MTANQRDLVLITGASGFVGSAVARIAQEKGYAVRVLVRPTSPRTNLAALDAEIVTGDMRDVASMRAVHEQPHPMPRAPRSGRRSRDPRETRGFHAQAGTRRRHA